HIAIDLGASGGRAMLAVLDGEPLVVRLEEAHRFSHEPLDTPAGPVWDLTTLWREVLAGIEAAAVMAREAGVEIKSVGCDTWGVDWGLVEPGGELVGLPHAYRDTAHAVAPRHAASPGLFAIDGSSLLLLPDLLHYWLSGVRANERTNASTTSMLSAVTGDWDRELLATVGLPSVALGKIVEPGTRLGPVRPELAASLGLSSGVQVVAPGTHDTASAVAAVPAAGEEPGSWAYLSSGTWSLLGVELDRPMTSREAFEAGFTNEQGVAGKTRFLRNIAGLWLVQELRRDLERQGKSYDYAQLADLAAEAPALRTIVDPNAEDLASPGDSIAKLRGHAERTAQPIPDTPGQLARCCLDSLALCYADTIERIESLTDYRIATLYLVGGGVNNRLLNQLAADATGRTVKLGPSEATALGNALVQAMGLGLVKDIEALRGVVARSQSVEVVKPNTASADWAAAKSCYREQTNSPR
ncbi:rhaB, partial [Symbiodinium sp. CCMP2456]